MKNIIEPCCMHDQLPKLMQGAKSGVFYSNGDWGIQKLMFSVGWLVAHPAVTVLLLPSVDVFFCRYLLEWLRKDWSTCIILATKEDCTELVANELRGMEERVAYVCRKNLEAFSYIRYNDKERFVISGPLAVAGNGAFSQFNYQYKCSVEDFAAVVSPLVSMWSVKLRKEKLGKCKDIQEFFKRKYHLTVR